MEYGSVFSDGCLFENTMGSDLGGVQMVVKRVDDLAFVFFGMASFVSVEVLVSKDVPVDVSPCHVEVLNVFAERSEVNEEDVLRGFGNPFQPARFFSHLVVD